MTEQINYMELPPDALIEGDPLRYGGVVELPFDANYFWWVRGESRIPPTTGSGVLHFGGWATDATTADGMMTPLPSFFVRETFLDQENKEYDVYTARSLAVALIGTRFRWLEKENRGHTQNLCYLAEMDKETKTLIPWGPIVLTTKGTTSMAVESRFKEWERMTAQARREIAPNVPWWYFYNFIGTFGNERIQQMVGKDQHQAHVTPPQIFPPSGTTYPTEHLQARFVGVETAAAMKEYHTYAEEWLAAWDKPEGEEYDATTGATRNNGTTQTRNYTEPEQPPSYDEFPPI